MAKILISPIGASNTDKGIYEREYRKAKYVIEDKNNRFEKESPFIASVLIDYLKVDKVILIGTARSMWENVYKHYGELIKNFDEKYWIHIGRIIEESSYNNYRISEDDLKKIESVIDDYLRTINQNATGGSCCKLIKYGRNEEELWDNFDIFMEIINNEVQDGDEVYLDITHSFRSIPLFMYIMMEFIQTLRTKDIKLSGLYYGMLDVSRELRYTPVVDLKPLFEISKWVKGVYDFTNYGNGYYISELLFDEDEGISHSIGKVSTYVDANYLGDLRKEIKNLKKLMENSNIEKTKFLKYFKPHIDEFLNRFNNVDSDYQFQLAMAKWHFDNKKYSAGYLCLTDSIFWGLCEIYGINTCYKNRELMKSIVRDDGIKLYEKYPQLEELRDIHDELRDIRNKIAHADVSDIGKSDDAIKKTKELYEKVKETLNKRESFNLPKELPLDELIIQYKNKNNIKNACLCLSLIIIKKLCEIYGLNPKKHYNCELMNTLLLNRRLHNNNNLLSKLNNSYYNITIKSKYTTLNDFEKHYRTAKNVLNDGRLKYISKDIPLSRIKSEYEKYKNSRNSHRRKHD